MTISARRTDAIKRLSISIAAACAAGLMSVQVGHFDRTGGVHTALSWNSAHSSRGCSQEKLVSTGGAGYFYCFAVN